MSYKIWSLLCLVLLVSACSWEANVYEPPKNAFTAPVYFDIPKHVDIGVFDGNNCKPGKYGTNLKKALKNAKRFNVAQIHKCIPYYLKSRVADEEIKMLSLPAGHPLVLSVYYTTDFENKGGTSYYTQYRYCSLSSKMVLRPNSEYIVRFNWHRGRCALYIFDIERSNQHQKFLPPARFENLTRHCIK